MDVFCPSSCWDTGLVLGSYWVSTGLVLLCIPTYTCNNQYSTSASDANNGTCKQKRYTPQLCIHTYVKNIQCSTSTSDANSGTCKQKRHAVQLCIPTYVYNNQYNTSASDTGKGTCKQNQYPTHVNRTDCFN